MANRTVETLITEVKVVGAAKYIADMNAMAKAAQNAARSASGAPGGGGGRGGGGGGGNVINHYHYGSGGGGGGGGASSGGGVGGGLFGTGMTFYAGSLMTKIRAVGSTVITALGKIPGVGWAAAAALGVATLAIVGLTKTLGPLAEAAKSIVVPSLDMAGEWERMAATLTALTGSPDLAMQKLNFVRQLAIPSNYTAVQLAEVGTALEAFGYRLEFALPTLAKLGMAFGADEERRQMIVRMFGLLGTGRMPEVRALSRFGISKQDFADRGIKFNSIGAPVDNKPVDMVLAFVDIVEDRYGKMFEMMQNTYEAKKSAMVDMIERGMIQLGEALFPLTKPLFDAISQFFLFLSQTGRITGFIQSIVSALGGDPDKANLGDIIINGLIRAWDFLENFVPKGIAFVKGFVDSLIGVFDKFAKVIGFIWAGVGDVIITVLNTLITSWNVVATAINVAVNAYRAFGNLFRRFIGLGENKYKGNLLPTFNKIDFLSIDEGYKLARDYSGLAAFGVGAAGEFMKPQNTIRPFFDQWFEKNKGKWNQMPPGAGEGHMFNNSRGIVPEDEAEGIDVAPSTGYLRDIRDNTAPLRDLSRIIMGGGELGKMGVTPAEIAVLRGAGAGGGNVTINVNGGNYDQIKRLIQQVVRGGQVRF